MAEPVRVRRLSDPEGQKLQRLVRRGTGSTVRLRRAIVALASAGENSVPVIARLIQACAGFVEKQASTDLSWPGTWALPDHR